MAPSSVIFGCEGTILAPHERDFFREVDPWGFILFARNLESAHQIQALTDALREAVGRQAPILIDQEGGRVARLRSPLATEWPNPKEHVHAMRPDVAQAVMHLRYFIIAHEILTLGIDVNCAPMLDLIHEGTHPIISDRAYGAEASLVGTLGRSVAQGHLDAGVLPIMKHIPGHGRALVDSHLDLPRTSAPFDELMDTDFASFVALSDLPMAMTGHVVFDSIDPTDCATLSPKVINIIRTDIGFDGLLMTDDLSMKALNGSFAQRSAAALAAGCDMILHCNGAMPEMEEVMTSVPRLSEVGLSRADAALAARRIPIALDVEEARTRLADLIHHANAGES